MSRTPFDDGITQEELYEVMRGIYDELIDFVDQQAFRTVVEELYSLRLDKRPSFVRAVLLNPAEMRARGVELREDILILRSAFGDRRPTLFCVKKWLPVRYHRYWQNCNTTFDNPIGDDVPTGEAAWRKPLPADVQALVIASGLSAEKLESQSVD